MAKLKNVHWERILLVLWFVINLSIGVLTVHEYGISVDEPNNYRYADDTLDAYSSLFGTLYEPNYDTTYDGHGPAFVAIAGILIRGIQGLFPGMFAPDLWHFFYFITFQLTGLCLYGLTNRWFDKWTAWGVLVLFTTQPLLWGHAFINPKDIPFMFFFTLSIVLGFRMVDSIGAKDPTVSLEATTYFGSMKIWVVKFFRALCNQRIVFAGVALGLATAMRPIAPLAGAIIFLFLFLKVRFSALLTAIAYFLIAGIGAYLSWPYLWKAPITNFLESLKTTSGFPNRGPVLFMGNIYASNQLPRRFFPALLGLQLTEPALIFISIGALITLYLFIRGKNREPILLFALWFLPLTIWIVFSRSSLYDNARQLLFLWPPLFILAGTGINSLMNLIKPALARVILVIAMVFPGVYASIQLHPYQYIYYNSLAGGVKGAYRNFELDYWATSFKESMDYLNGYAEQDATIVVIGARPVARLYARPDLIVVGPGAVVSFQNQPYYILSSTRANKDGSYCGDSETVFTVEREGGVLSSIKKILPGQICK